MSDFNLRSYSAATDPVRGLDHPLPISERSGRKSPEYWEEQMRRRQQRKKQSPETHELPELKDNDHHIDGYA
jgi:hypothetical protein